MHQALETSGSTAVECRSVGVADDIRSSPMWHAMPIVFVIDDDISVRESLELMIRNAGWQVETFETAQGFLSRPRIAVPSCLVLDVALPGLSGLDLQKHVVINRTDLPIIFITAPPLPEPSSERRRSERTMFSFQFSAVEAHGSHGRLTDDSRKAAWLGSVRASAATSCGLS
jgi:CheY-like chemotaxis protein